MLFRADSFSVIVNKAASPSCEEKEYSNGEPNRTKCLLIKSGDTQCALHTVCVVCVCYEERGYVASIGRVLLAASWAPD